MTPRSLHSSVIGLEQLRPAFLVCLLSLFVAPLGAAPSEATTAAAWERQAPPLRIGYMQPEAPGGLDTEWFRGLIRFLETDPGCAELRKELEGRYGGFSLIAAEGYNDLVRRMENLELDVVFCPAVAFAQQMLPRASDRATTAPRRPDRQGNYAAVFQLKGPRDIGRIPMRHGVIIVNRSHPLFRPPDARHTKVDPAVIARHVANEPIAFVSRYSGAGYIYPLHELFIQLRESAWPNQPTFCGSSEEVVKLVLSGVVAMGACENGTVDEVVKRFNERYQSDIRPEQAIDVLLQTPGCPTDPIVFLDTPPRRSLNPGRSRLGGLLRSAIEKYFRFSPNRPRRLDLVGAESSEFESVRQTLSDMATKFNPGENRP